MDLTKRLEKNLKNVLILALFLLASLRLKLRLAGVRLVLDFLPRYLSETKTVIAGQGMRMES